MSETVQFNDGNTNSEIQVNSNQKTEANYESRTVVLPIQLNIEGKDLWKNLRELDEGIRETLSSFTIGKEFTWKRVVDDTTEHPKSNEIIKSNAFENESNLQLYYQNFTPEVADTLYGNADRILHFIAQCGNKANIDEKILGIAKADNGLEIASCADGHTIMFEIRKIRLSATVFGTCLLTIESHQNSTTDGKGIILNDDYWNIESICNSLGIKSNEKLRVSYPTKCHSYMASLVWRKDITAVKMEYGKKSICKEIPLCFEDMTKDIEYFFGITFECFWIGILQKTVAMYISSWASSRRTLNREFDSVYEAYVLFDNQFNFLEVSFNPKTQQEYEVIKANMNNEDTVEKLIRQIEALHSINLNKQDGKRNIILAFITMLSLVIGCMQVAESFGPNPSIAANVISGVVSFAIGLVLFFFFVK